VDLDAERDGVRRKRRESMSRAKTLVIGATGMTGSHTVQLLLKRGHTVRVIAHNEDERSMRLQELGAEVVIGRPAQLLDDSVRRYRSIRYARRPAYEGVERRGREKSKRRTTGRWSVSLSAHVRAGVSRPYSPGRPESRPSSFASPCLGVPSP